MKLMYNNKKGDKIMKRKEELNIQACQREIGAKLSNVDAGVELLMTAIQKGSALKDDLLLEEKNSVSFDRIKGTVSFINTCKREARANYDQAKSKFDDIYVAIQSELATANEMDSIQFHGLKKLRSETTDAKQKLRGYNINSLENLADETIKEIRKAAKKRLMKYEMLGIRFF